MEKIENMMGLHVISLLMLRKHLSKRYIVSEFDSQRDSMTGDIVNKQQYVL